jgi:hypothetical protein
MVQGVRDNSVRSDSTDLSPKRHNICETRRSDGGWEGREQGLGGETWGKETSGETQA